MNKKSSSQRGNFPLLAKWNYDSWTAGQNPEDLCLQSVSQQTQSRMSWKDQDFTMLSGIKRSWRTAYLLRVCHYCPSHGERKWEGPFAMELLACMIKPALLSQLKVWRAYKAFVSTGWIVCLKPCWPFIFRALSNLTGEIKSWLRPLKQQAWAMDDEAQTYDKFMTRAVNIKHKLRLG